MKQSLYEKIKTIVEAGQIAICKFDNGDYILFSSMFYRGEGKTPYIRSSNRGNDINNCYQSLGASYETRYNIDKRNLKYIGIYERPLWRPKKGDLVQCLERYKNLNFQWIPPFFEPLKVIESEMICYVIDSRENIYDLPYDCIAPRVEIDTI